MTPPGTSLVVGGDACEFERGRVGERHVPVVAADEDGAILDVLVDSGRGREFSAEGAVVIPVATEQPAVARGILVELG